MISGMQEGSGNGILLTVDGTTREGSMDIEHALHINDLKIGEKVQVLRGRKDFFETAGFDPIGTFIIAGVKPKNNIIEARDPIGFEIKRGDLLLVERD